MLAYITRLLGRATRWMEKRYRSPALDRQRMFVQRDLQLIRDRKHGLNLDQLSAKYKISHNRVNQILTEYGERRKRWSKMAPETRLEILQLHLAGKSNAEIARLFGVSRERVRQIIQNAEKVSDEPIRTDGTVPDL